VSLCITIRIGSTQNKFTSWLRTPWSETPTILFLSPTSQRFITKLLTEGAIIFNVQLTSLLSLFCVSLSEFRQRCHSAQFSIPSNIRVSDRTDNAPQPTELIWNSRWTVALAPARKERTKQRLATGLHCTSGRAEPHVGFPRTPPPESGLPPWCRRCCRASGDKTPAREEGKGFPLTTRQASLSQPVAYKTNHTLSYPHPRRPGPAVPPPASSPNCEPADAMRHRPHA